MLTINEGEGGPKILKILSALFMDAPKLCANGILGSNKRVDTIEIYGSSKKFGYSRINKVTFC